MLLGFRPEEVVVGVMARGSLPSRMDGAGETPPEMPPMGGICRASELIVEDFSFFFFVMAMFLLDDEGKFCSKK